MFTYDTGSFPVVKKSFKFVRKIIIHQQLWSNCLVMNLKSSVMKPKSESNIFKYFQPVNLSGDPGLFPATHKPNALPLTDV